MTDTTALIQSAYACFGRGDIPGLLDMMSPDIEWTFKGDRRATYTGRFTGKGQVGEWFGCVGQSDDIQAFEPREFIAGPGSVTVLGWERTRLLPDGGTFESDWVHVWQVRDGKITRFWGMLDTEAVANARV